LLTRQDGAPRHWQFDEPVSAAGWLDDTRLLIASASALLAFSLETGQSEKVCALEADTPVTRSNDGRADPFGGFWIGTMGRSAEAGAGAIYRYYKGELRKLFGQITISNAICFSPDGLYGYFTDTETAQIMRVALDQTDGWPKGDPQVWCDLRAEGHRPDGAVTDADGNLWSAQYGSARMACYDPQGRFLRAIALPARNTTCPAFGGAGLATLYCTSAAQNLDADVLEREPGHGQTFAVTEAGIGRPEPRVLL
ncbi:hypothetical protein LCGC14_2191490, partial [marine sediment metagenome]